MGTVNDIGLDIAERVAMVSNNEGLQLAVEQFLFREVRMIDEQQLEQWFEQYTEDGRYCVPGQGDGGADGQDGFIINENHKGIEFRIKRLLHQSAHTQIPPMRTLHVITNVLVGDIEKGEADVTCALVVHWARGLRSGNYAGTGQYRLRFSNDGTIRIVTKTVWLVNRDQPQDRMPIL